MEDIETLEGRPPKDIDVVTYFHMPSGETQATLSSKAGDLFKHAYVKSTYFVDAYPHPLGSPTDANQVRLISYWYSMWSHRRTGLWKGFIQVSLDPQEDIDARLIINGITAGVAP